MISKKNLNKFDIEKLNQDLNDEGIIYDLDILHIDVLSLDQDNEDKEDGEKKHS
ncbi:TPA: hypothetical protein RNY11_002070 [Pasteurella multocida]|nr:hypothetical protein [Pasteurella multocida]HDX1177487.1 hypothetical protein [Pasteurella multocida]